MAICDAKNKNVDKPEDQAGRFVFPVIISAVSVLVFFPNLSNRYLWQDEAENALVSKTILTYGFPKGCDGKNFFSQEGTVSYGKNYLWALDPWIPFYLVAASFKLFDISTFAARLPFTIFGAATVLLTFFFTRLLTGNTLTAKLAAVLMLLSVPFILLSRQSRYYSLIAFLSLLSLYGYLMVLEKRKLGSIVFVISSILIFHSNHLFCATLLTTVCIHCWFFHTKRFKKVLVLSFAVAAVNLPWAVFISGTRYTKRFLIRLFDANFFMYLKQYIHHIHFYIFPAYLLLIPLVRFCLLRAKAGRAKTQRPCNVITYDKLTLLVIFVVITVLALSVASTEPHFRYLAQLIPVFSIITAVIIISVIRKRFKTYITIFFAALAVLFIVDYQYQTRHPGANLIKYLNPLDYLYEITHDYDGPIEGIVKYLKENGTEDNIVAMTYGDLPIKFYTNMRVVGGWTGENLTPAKNADWVIIRKYALDITDIKAAKFILENVPLEKYEKITLDYPDVKWASIPSPSRHLFRTVENEDRVVIYRKK